jgi:hypothetical protein
MSYINFSITHRFEGGAVTPFPRTETVSTGFSREGGRVEFVEHSASNRGPLPPRETSINLTGSVTKAADGVRDAIQAAGWVQAVLVKHGDGGQPDLVSWTYRNGGADQGLTGSLPTPVQTVLDAAKVLEDAAHAQVVYDGS